MAYHELPSRHNPYRAPLFLVLGLTVDHAVFLGQSCLPQLLAWFHYHDVDCAILTIVRWDCHSQRRDTRSIV